MNCKHLKIRTKKGVHYKYCTLLKKEIKDECYNCINKEYKNYSSLKKSKIKGHKHKSTKATEISKSVKEIVWERDKHSCIYCGCYVSVEYANSHFIKRGQLGLGIEENIVTACYNCHYNYDFKDFDKQMYIYTRNYLKNLYNGWNEDILVYKKNY